MSRQGIFFLRLKFQIHFEKLIKNVSSVDANFFLVGFLALMILYYDPHWSVMAVQVNSSLKISPGRPIKWTEVRISPSVKFEKML